MPRLSIALLGLFILAAVASPSPAQIGVEEAFPNLPFLAFPLDLKDPYDGTDRLFAAEKKGKIFTFWNDPAVTAAHLFLDLTDRVLLGAGEGFYSLAFHPDYENNGYVFTIYAKGAPLRTAIARYTVSAADSNAGDKSSELIILEIPKANNLHFGATLEFGGDGYLYASIGDDGVGDNAQDLAKWHGKVLRLDVDNPGGGKNYGIPPTNPFFGNVSGYLEEIYAYGLRNPWRFSFNSVDGSLWLGDVGVAGDEEIDIILSGRNYGWPMLEGLNCHVPDPCDTDTTGLNLVNPIHVYDPATSQAVTGGHVYRGARHPGLVGKYVYTDFQVGTIWALYYDGSAPTLNQIIFNSPALAGVATIGEDKDGELYFPSFQDGRIYLMTGDFPWPDPTGITKVPARRAELGQNYPNPFNPQTSIDYTVHATGLIDIGIFDVTGRRVKTLVSRRMEPGSYTATWDATNNAGLVRASGVYFYRLFVDGAAVDTRRMLLLK